MRTICYLVAITIICVAVGVLVTGCCGSLPAAECLSSKRVEQ